MESPLYRILGIGQISLDDDIKIVMPGAGVSIKEGEAWLKSKTSRGDILYLSYGVEKRTEIPKSDRREFERSF